MLKKSLTAAILSIIVLICINRVSAHDDPGGSISPDIKVELTRQEKEFLKSHPVIRIGSDHRWEPYTIKKADGTIEGLNADLINLVNERSGAGIEIVAGPWSEMVEQAKELKIDGLASSTASKERARFFNFSTPYVSVFPVFVVKGNSELRIGSIDDLNGRAVAFLKGNQFFRNLLKKHPSIHKIESSSEIEAIKLVIEGRADAAIVATTLYSNYNKIFGKDIKIGYLSIDTPLDIVFSVRKDWPELNSIINKSLASLTPAAKNRLFFKWFGFNPADLLTGSVKPPISLTAREKAWIKAHPKIRLGVDPAWQPVEFIDKSGQYQGIVSDYIELLNTRLGINMEVIPNLSWTQLMEAVPQRGVDVMSALLKTPQREKYLSFTEPFLSIDWVIVHPRQAEKISGLADFSGGVVAVVEGYAVQDTIERTYPGITLLPERTTVDALQSVRQGRADAAVVEGQTAIIIIHGYRMHDLEISQQIFQHDRPLFLGVRNDWPELVQILNRGLASITEAEREKIRQKWMAVPIHIGMTGADILRIVFYVLAAMGVLLGLSLFWNRRLKREVNEKRVAKQALEASSSLMRIGESIANLGFFERNWQTGQGRWSDGFKSLLGLKHHEGYTHEEFTRFIHPDDRRRVGEAIQHSLKTRTQMDVEFRLVKADGTVVDIHGIGVNSYDNEGNPLITRGSFQDISERRRAEEETANLQNQLMQAHKLESIGTLAGGIAHDFNNILSSIIGFTELALRDVEKGTEIEDDLQEVRHAGLRAKDLVSQILTFARQSDEEVKPLQVNVIITEVLGFLKSSIPASVQIRDEINSDSFIMGSPTQVHQILMNLCTNAAQAMEEEGGVLEVCLNDVIIDRTSSVRGVNPGDYIRVDVKDSGTGISPQDLAFIFEPYFTTKEVGEGTGLGLAVVHGIVEGYGGKITVESVAGEGSCFSIYLPITKRRMVHDRSEIEDLPSGTENILLVDDEAAIVKMGQRILMQLGYTVTARTSSIEALELFRAKPQAFDLVITDMTMPNMTGDKLAAELMKIRPEIPVILCTGYSKSVSKENAMSWGIRSVAFKPLVQSDIANMVREVLDEVRS